MKRFILLLFLSTLSAVLFNACRKNYSDEKYIEDGNSVKPDLSVKVTTSVSGFITDESGKAITGALVISGSQQANTNEYGYFYIKDVALPAVAGFIRVKNVGYFDGFKTFVAKEGSETFLRLQLIPAIDAGTIESAIGGAITTTDGAKIEVIANTLNVATTNTPYAGTVHVAAHWLNPANANTLQNTMPGDLRGIDTAGYVRNLTTYGMLAVALTGNAGEMLQIAAGKQATITVPIPAALASTAPNTLPLWYFDETTGLWMQQGVATKTGSNYVGSVGHFSYWNCDVPNPISSFTTQIVNEQLQPLKNVLVEIASANQPNNKCWAYTDSSGHLYSHTPANSNLVLNVLTDCYTTAYSKKFTTTNQPTDLGTIVANVSANNLVIFGSVANCNQQPVKDGVVFFSNQLINNRVAIINGSFSYVGLNCTNAESQLEVIAEDYSNPQQALKKTVTIQPGTNNLGELNACGVSTTEFIAYTLDAGEKTTIEPPGDPTTFVLQIDPVVKDSLTIISSDFKANDNVTIGHMDIAFNGGTSIGDHNLLLLNISIPAPGINASAPLPTVIITEYGAVGEFVAGSFNGSFTDNNNVSHTIDCSFRVRRQ